MHGADKNKLTWCDECGNALHRECFDQCTSFIWPCELSPFLMSNLITTGARTSANNLTCVWCRAKWILPASGNGAASGSMTSEGYMNLGGVAGVNTVRDTSSCTNHALALCSMLMLNAQITMGRRKADDIMVIRSTGDRWCEKSIQRMVCVSPSQLLPSIDRIGRSNKADCTLIILYKLRIAIVIFFYIFDLLYFATK